MKNGYTPKEYAHTIAVDALAHAIKNTFGDLDALTPSEQQQTIDQLRKLRLHLADKAKLDILPF